MPMPILSGLAPDFTASHSLPGSWTADPSSAAWRNIVPTGAPPAKVPAALRTPSPSEPPINPSPTGAGVLGRVPSLYDSQAKERLRTNNPLDSRPLTPPARANSPVSLRSAAAPARTSEEAIAVASCLATEVAAVASCLTTEVGAVASRLTTEVAAVATSVVKQE